MSKTDRRQRRKQRGHQKISGDGYILKIPVSLDISYAQGHQRRVLQLGRQRIAA